MSQIATCRVCGEQLYDAVVRCVDCEAPHHVDCFAWTGHCATYACGSRRYSHLGLRGRDVTVFAAPEKPPLALKSTSSSSRRPAVRAPMTILLDVTSPEEALVETLPRAVAAVTFAALLGLAYHVGGYRYQRLNVAIALAAFPAAMVPAMLLTHFRQWLADCYYVVDTRDGALLYHRSVFGRARTRFVAKLESVCRIRIESSRCVRFGGEDEPDVEGAHYWLLLELAEGARLIVSDRLFRESPKPAPDELIARAKQLSLATGVQLEQVEVEDLRAAQGRRRNIEFAAIMVPILGLVIWALVH